MRAYLLVPLLVLAALLIAAADQEAGIRPWMRLRADLRKAGETIAVLEARNDLLRRQASALRSEPFALERVIRETLAFARPGEVVVRFPPDVARPSGSRSAADDLRTALSGGPE